MDEVSKARVDTALRVVASIIIPCKEIEYKITHNDSTHVSIIRMNSKEFDILWVQSDMTYELIITSIDKAYLMTSVIVKYVNILLDAIECEQRRKMNENKLE